MRAANRALGDSLRSAYAIGSLGHGGFEAATSDVDLALLTAGAAGGAVPVDQIRREVERELPGPLSERLSIFHVPWASFASPPPGCRFPAIDRLDLMRSGVLVRGEDLRSRFGVEPAPGEVLEGAVSAALSRRDPEGLRSEIAGFTPAMLDGRAASKLVLWPVRLLHTAETVGSGGERRGRLPLSGGNVVTAAPAAGRGCAFLAQYREDPRPGGGTDRDPGRADATLRRDLREAGV